MSVMKLPTGSTITHPIKYNDDPYDLFIFFIASLIVWRYLIYI